MFLSVPLELRDERAPRERELLVAGGLFVIHEGEVGLYSDHVERVPERDGAKLVPAGGIGQRDVDFVPDGADDLTPPFFAVDRLVQFGPDHERVAPLRQSGDLRDPRLVRIEETVPRGFLLEEDLPAPREP